jgi:hypothetical protein
LKGSSPYIVERIIWRSFIIIFQINVLNRMATNT